MEILIAIVVGMVANRAGAKWARALPDSSKLKRPAVVIFGGGGGGPKEPV
jgi:hypothetical protein